MVYFRSEDAKGLLYFYLCIGERIMAEERPYDREMSFLDHLEELRWHLVRAVAAIFVFAIVALVNKEFVFHTLILGPSRPDFWTYRWLCMLGEAIDSANLCIDSIPFVIQNRTMTGQFTTHLTVSFLAGFIVSFPYIFWEIWRFVKPGLYPSEQRLTRGSVFFVSLLFAIGISFGYLVVAPLSVNFLANYQVDPSIINEIDLGSYISTVMMLTLACGLLFELPMIVYVLSKAGIVSPKQMKTYRRHSIVGILGISAIITPSDVMSMILVAIPLLVLYEISIFISANVWKKRRKKLAELESKELADVPKG